MRKRIKAVIAVAVLGVVTPALAQEVVVTGQRRGAYLNAETNPSSSRPIINLRRTADFAVQPVHIIGSFPHMHELGRTFRTEVTRAGSPNAQVLVDVPLWNFESQTMYPEETPFQFNPGDSIRTTCTYDNFTGAQVNFGERTEDEMCFNFVLLYPISMFNQGRTCVGLF